MVTVNGEKIDRKMGKWPKIRLTLFLFDTHRRKNEYFFSIEVTKNYVLVPINIIVKCSKNPYNYNLFKFKGYLSGT